MGNYPDIKKKKEKRKIEVKWMCCTLSYLPIPYAIKLLKCRPESYLAYT